MSRDFSVSSEWIELAGNLDRVAEAVRTYLLMPEAAWPDSTSARERATTDTFAALPWAHPTTHAAMMPLSYLGNSQDHLTGLAAIMRTPRTVMAQLTVLRTQLVASARAAWMLEPDIDHRERMRRAINFDLESKTEQMLMHSGRSDPDTRAEYERLERRRRDIIKAAKALGWHTTTPEKRRRPEAWWVGNHPLSEMHLVERVLGDAATPGRAGLTLYRYLSATSHAQSHGIASLIRSEHTVSHGDGSATAGIGMTGEMIMTLSLMAVGSLTIAMGYATRYYGWPQQLWVNDVMPLVADLRMALGVQPTPLGLPLLG